MNKKADGEILFIIAILFFIIAAACSSLNPQQSFMNDCRKAYANDFKMNSTCTCGGLEGFFNNTLYDCDCMVTDKTELEKHCLNKYANPKEKDDE